MLGHYSLVPRLLEGCSSFTGVAHSRSKPANESLDLVWLIGALHAFGLLISLLFHSFLHFIH
jgi:hypothetical protein